MRLIDADTLKEEFDMSWQPDMAVTEMWSVIDNAQTVGGWISVKDRLPEKETLVLALVQYEVGWYRMLAWRDKKGWASSQEEFSEHDGDFVTHWMPLPELPKEVGK